MHRTISRLVVTILCLVSFECYSQYHSKKYPAPHPLYVDLGVSHGWGIGSTKIARTEQLGVRVGLGYKITDNLNLEVGYQYNLMVLLFRDLIRADLPNLTSTDFAGLEPGSIYGGNTCALTYLHPPPRGDANWYLSGGFSNQHAVHQPQATRWSQTFTDHDSTTTISVNGTRVLSFVAPYIEWGIYSRLDGHKRPTIGGVGFHLGFRYTYTPTIYHGTYHQESSDGSVKDSTMIMSGGSFSIVVSTPLGIKPRIDRGSASHRKRKSKRKKMEPKLEQKFQMKSKVTST